MSLQSTEINSVKVTFNQEKTREYRTDFNKPCDCLNCRNFYKHMESNTELVAFLSAFGVDYHCTEEVFSWDWGDDPDSLIHHQGFYGVFGEIEEAFAFEKFGVKIAFLKDASIPHDRTCECFWICVEGDFPYILAEEESPFSSYGIIGKFVDHCAEQGQLQWSYSLGRKRSFFMQMKYAFMGMLLFLLPMMLFPVLKLSNWNIMILLGGAAVFSLTVASVAIWKNKLDISYQITTKKIFADKGIPLSTTYENIKKVKLKRSIFNKNIGTVKLYLKKGLSINYSLEGISDCDKAYQLILENMKK